MTALEARARGERHGNAKLTVEQVRQIRELRAGGALLLAIARRFGVSEKTVSIITRREGWRHVP